MLWPDVISRGDAAALRRFVTRGGRLVVADLQPGSWLGGVVADPPVWADGPLGPARALAPLPETAGARTLAAGVEGRFTSSGSAVAAFGTSSATAVAVARAGKGRAVLLADAAPLVNSRLARRDDAAFALAAVGAGRPVAFLESVHGYGRASGFGALPGRFRGALVLLALAGAALMLARGRRLGPAQPQGRALAPPRAAYAEALAGALARSRPAPDAIAPVVAEARSLLLVPDGRRRRSAARRRARRGAERGGGPGGRARRAGSRDGARGSAGSGTHQRAEGTVMIEAFERVRAQVGRTIVGQERTVDLALVAACTGGHVLLEGPPGVAKTLAVNALSQALGLGFRRVQFTPDMLPSDVTGTMTLRGGELAFRPGPVFTNVLLADEINRTPPKTQAALLEAMQERQVTVDGESRPLPAPFLVAATQNPIEYEGTYPLPEAQLDRFLFRIDVGYPDEAGELAILRLPHRGVLAPSLAGSEAVAGADDLEHAGALIDGTTVSDEVAAYLAAVVRKTRELPAVELGASPRAAVHLLAAARAAARLAGRAFVTPDDVIGMAAPVLAHRLVLRPEAELERVTPEAAVAAAIAAVAVPR